MPRLFDIYVTKHECIHVIPNNVWCMLYCLMYPMYSKTLQTLHHTGYIDNHEQKSILCIWQFRFLCFSQGWFKIDHTSGLVVAFTYPRPMLNRIWLLVMTQDWGNQNTNKRISQNGLSNLIIHAVNLVDSLILPVKRPSFFSISWRLPKSAHFSTSLKDDPTHRACHRGKPVTATTFFTSTEFVVRRFLLKALRFTYQNHPLLQAENEWSETWFP